MEGGGTARAKQGHQKGGGGEEEDEEEKEEEEGDKVDQVDSGGLNVGNARQVSR